MQNSEAAAAATPWTQQWALFRDRLGARLAQLAAELAACWDEQAALLDRTLVSDAGAPGTPGLPAYRQVRRESADGTLIEPMAEWERRRPYQRAMEAIEACDRSVEELLMALPERIETSGPQAIRLAGRETVGPVRRLLLGFRSERTVPLREVATACMERLQLARIPIERRYFAVHLRAAQELGRAWHPAREAIDAAARGAPPDSAVTAAALAASRARFDALRGEAAASLAAWEERPAATARLLASALAAAVLRGGPPARKRAGRREAHLRAWAANWRALEAGLRLEVALEACEDRIATLFARAVEGLEAEQARVMAELESLAGWLRRCLEGSRDEPPPPRADIVPAMARLVELEAALEAELAALPESCHLLGFRQRLRQVRPRERLRESFRRNGRAELAELFGMAESEHRKVLQEIGRAGEVAAFGLQSGQDYRLEREALENALSLLEFYRRRTPEWPGAAGPRMTAVLGAVFSDARYRLERRLGAAALLARHGLRRAWPLAARGAAEAAASAFETGRHGASSLATRFLEAIGWRSASSAGWTEVVSRPLLPPEFRPGATGTELPALYRHLFRFEPVEDPRFLVGRAREMAAIAEARAMWEASRPAAVLIVGERGSGKTSLVNCALKQRLQDTEVIRGEFQQRLHTEEDLRAFLSSLLGAAPADLEHFLLDRPRVVVLEELERSFLRHIGCLGAIRALQRLVMATCTRVLWVLTTNTVAFRFMHAAAQLGAGFSHRINAATAARDDLRSAILCRHDLSGLRLEFAPPPTRRRTLAAMERLLRRAPDPEAAFFDVLSRESDGVFRTAFDIWLGYIEGVQAGLLYMKPLGPPDLSPVIDDLSASDLFTLVAILQHGSLTAEEHAAVFEQPLSASRARIDELAAREIIEPDPGRTGFRVRPKAARVVKEALYRRNLL